MILNNHIAYHNVGPYDAAAQLPARDEPFEGVCPLGGDIVDDCADCIYTGDYHYDPEKQDCVLRDTD